MLVSAMLKVTTGWTSLPGEETKGTHCLLHSAVQCQDFVCATDFDIDINLKRMCPNLWVAWRLVKVQHVYC